MPDSPHSTHSAAVNGPTRTVLGIDPGTRITGWGVVRGNRSRCFLLRGGIIKLDDKTDHYERLRALYSGIEALIEEFHPEELAVEAPFYGKNAQSMLKLGRAQGVAISVAMNRGLAVFEYPPRKIKSAITGNGNASKEQVSRMLRQMLELEELPASLDESDAVAAAVCHLGQFAESGGVQDAPSKRSGSSDHPAKSGNFGSWSAFLKKHPDRVHGKKR
jgi:crossover junction endodeoxyribonuclease RuvC